MDLSQMQSQKYSGCWSQNKDFTEPNKIYEESEIGKFNINLVLGGPAD